MNNRLDQIKAYIRAADYLTVCQIYLQDNFLLERPLAFDDIKPRLLGHWGTCPGINFIYAHLNAFIKDHHLSTLFVLGPGHGFPALQANLFLEGTLGDFYPQAQKDAEGLAYIIKNFSWPYGFPSHSFPGAPGVIIEGGELGYALSMAYGAVLDNPDLLVACVIGDGEAETGPTAAAWHLNKFIDPKTCGTVLPILHLNGYKISGPTIFGRMKASQLRALFNGYGYEPFFVRNGPRVHQEMHNALNESYKIIKEIKQDAQNSSPKIPYRFPMIILDTPKGWTGIKEFNHTKIEGNCLSHQVVVKEAKTDKKALHALEKWLRSYQFNELFKRDFGFIKDIEDSIPEKNERMGHNKHAFGGNIYQSLALPDLTVCSEDVPTPGYIGSSSMRRAGCYLKKVIELNISERNFRFFSPDETYSNKLDAIFNATGRAFVMPLKKWDCDLAADGRVIEILSEHCLQGLAQGYLMTGRHAVFASYEAFISIVDSMAAQYAKFLLVSQEFPWRKPIASLNYILTSSGWRQEHNGFSHQNPGFISSMLMRQGCFIRVYFPPDGNSTLVVLKHALQSTNGINVIVAGKTQEPRWLTVEQAEKQFEKGLMIWDFASDIEPDLVFSAVGDYLVKESLAAIDYLKGMFPALKLRFVSILELSGIGMGNATCGFSFKDFEHYFTKEKPVIFNFHGYPDTLKAMLFCHKNADRFYVHGYIENGSTTTPFDMQVRNKTSRFHLAIEALQIVRERGIVDRQEALEKIRVFEKKLEEHTQYIKKYGVDMPEVESWQWKKSRS